MSKRKGRKRKMTLETLLGLMHRGEWESRKYGRLLDSPEDAKQEYARRLLDGLHQRASVEQAVLDMVRHNSDPRMPGYEQKKALHLAVPVDPERILQGQNPINTMNHRIFLQEAISKLKPREQALMKLYLQGYTGKEIAAEFELTESRVNQMFHKAVAKMRKIAKIRVR